MMKLKRVGEPEVSPDGKWVIFSVVDVDLAANTKTPHIWIVPTVGGQERILLPNSQGDRPRWSPDGKHFAFIADGGRGSQVWIADFDTAAGTVGGAHELTAIATETGGEVWSPDGKNILFTSDVYPECDGTPEAAAACNCLLYTSIRRRSLFFLLRLRNFLALIQNPHVRSKSFVVLVLHDLADMDVARVEVERVVGARIRRKPVFVVNLLPPRGELRVKVLFFASSLRILYFGNGLSLSLIHI